MLSSMPTEVCALGRFEFGIYRAADAKWALLVYPVTIRGDLRRSARGGGRDRGGGRRR